MLWARHRAGVINALITRRNVLERPDSQGRLRPVGQYRFDAGGFRTRAARNCSLDRYLVAAEHMGTEPVLVLNKDLIRADSDVKTPWSTSGLWLSNLTTSRDD